jgi:hypothetical protein
VADFKGWVYLEDEMPRIGSGARLVTAKVGWKWVRAKSVTYPVPQWKMIHGKEGVKI